METITVQFKSVPIVDAKSDKRWYYSSNAPYTVTTTYNMSAVRDHVLTFTHCNTHRERLKEPSIVGRMLFYGPVIWVILMALCLGGLSSILPSRLEGIWLALVIVLGAILVIFLGALSAFLAYFAAGTIYENKRIASLEQLQSKARSDRGVDDQFQLACIHLKEWDSFVKRLGRNVLHR